MAPNMKVMTQEDLNKIFHSADNDEKFTKNFRDETTKQEFLNELSALQHNLDEQPQIHYAIKNRKGCVYVVNISQRTASKMQQSGHLGLAFSHMDTDGLRADSNRNGYDFNKMFEKEPRQPRTAHLALCLNCNRYILS